MPHPTIGSLWVGAELSWLEQLCLQSFLDHGHPVVLFTYDAVKGVPDGVQIADANAIYPAGRIIRHAKTGSPAYHADVFRLHMLQQTDYIWADTDAFCCQPWVFPGKHFHGWISDDKPLVNNGVLQLPKRSKTLARMLRFTGDEFPIPPWYSAEKRADLQARKEAGRGVHVSLLPWGVWGPDALTWFLKETGEIDRSRPGYVIYPVPFRAAGMVLNPDRRAQAEALIRDDTLSIHFWGRRFRNIAARYDGAAPEGSYVHGLLKKHGINQMKTQHLLSPPPEPTKTEPDLTMFDDHDAFNMVLQRSEIGPVRPMIQAYLAGDDAPLAAYARDNREMIVNEVFRIAERECDLFLPATDAIAPKRVADIGCGYGFADLVLYRRYGCDLVLIDIEDSDSRHFGFQAEGAGYTSLARARAFLEANGVPPGKIVTLNPKTDPLDNLAPFDLVVSLASCGFHYPISTYEHMFRHQVTPGGGIVLDIRKGSGGIGAMRAFGSVQVLAKHGKYSTVLTRVGA